MKLQGAMSKVAEWAQQIALQVTQQRAASRSTMKATDSSEISMAAISSEMQGGYEDDRQHDSHDEEDDEVYSYCEA